MSYSVTTYFLKAKHTTVRSTVDKQTSKMENFESSELNDALMKAESKADSCFDIEVKPNSLRLGLAVEQRAGAKGLTVTSEAGASSRLSTPPERFPRFL